MTSPYTTPTGRAVSCMPSTCTLLDRHGCRPPHPYRAVRFEGANRQELLTVLGVVPLKNRTLCRGRVSRSSFVGKTSVRKVMYGSTDTTHGSASRGNNYTHLQRHMLYLIHGQIKSLRGPVALQDQCPCGAYGRVACGVQRMEQPGAGTLMQWTVAVAGDGSKSHCR